MRNGLMEAHTSFSLFSRFSSLCGAFGVNIRIFWGFKEEYYTQRNRCQLTRCRVDQHSSSVRSLIAGVLFERESCCGNYWKKGFQDISINVLDFLAFGHFFALETVRRQFSKSFTIEERHRTLNFAPKIDGIN